MTRRLRWMAIGAVLGIAGYRRLARAGSARFPRMLQIPAFLRDVRAGMAEYERQHLAPRSQLDRHPDRSARLAPGVGRPARPVRDALAGGTQPSRASKGGAGPSRNDPKAGR